MNRLTSWWSRLREWWQSDRVEQEMEAELESHLQHLIDEHVRRGLTPTEARRAAQRELGGLAQAQALARDARGFRVIDAVLQDLRLGVRQLKKTPVFTLAALLTLAIGTGSTTAIYAMVDAVLMKPLPYTDPAQVVTLWEEGGKDSQRIAVSPANLRDYRARVTSFDSLAAYASLGRNLTGAGPAERILIEEVSPDYFRVFNVPPSIGRVLNDDDVRLERQVAVISHALWQRRFGGAIDVTARSIRINQVNHQIVGVLPADFVPPSDIAQTDRVATWLPMLVEPSVVANRKEHILSVVGRLRDGVELASAQRELSVAANAMRADFADYTDTRPVIDLLRSDQVAAVDTMLYVLLGAVGMVVLLASVNIAGLLIVRALGRQREIAVRYALGASRGRVLLEQGVQSLLLAVAGGASGLLLGHWLLRGLLAVAPTTIPLIGTAALDMRVAVVSIGVALITALSFGLWPALQAARIDPADTLKAHDRPASGSSLLARRSPVLIIEIAIATVVLVGAVLMIRSLARLQDVDLGFDPHNVVAAAITLPTTKYPTPAERHRFFAVLEGRLREMPGVTHVAFGNRLPLRGDWISGIVIDPVIPAGTAPAIQESGFQAVNPDYLATFGMSVLRGRALSDLDVLGSEPVALVNDTFGRVLLEGTDPIGRYIRRFPGAPAMRIVGVVADIRRTGRTDDEGRHAAVVVPQVYLPAAQTQLYPLPLRDIAVRAEPAVLARLATDLPQIVAEIDVDQPVTAVRTLEDTLALRSAQQRFQASLFLMFAAAAVILALVGTYGVVAYGVAERRSEIALRLALGATRRGVVGAVVGRTAVLLTIGCGAGLVVAGLAGEVLARLLFELPGRDPVTYVLVAAALVAAGALASAVAASRASAIDPIQALR